MDVEVKEIMETDTIGIDRIDPISDDSLVRIEEHTEGKPAGTTEQVKRSELGTLKTGNLISEVFKLISTFKEREHWKLNDKEITRLNNTCPKILPEQLVKHAGTIGCILSLIGMILKRVKYDRELDVEFEEVQPDQPDEQKSLTGGRNG